MVLCTRLAGFADSRDGMRHGSDTAKLRGAERGRLATKRRHALNDRQWPALTSALRVRAVCSAPKRCYDCVPFLSSQHHADFISERPPFEHVDDVDVARRRRVVYAMLPPTVNNGGLAPASSEMISSLASRDVLRSEEGPPHVKP
jgi:hypothetical protein